MPKKCIVCKKKRSNFGLPNDKKAQYCGDCKKTDMIDIKSPKCIVCNKKNPIFGKVGDKKAYHCGDCKKENMVDIKHPKCIICKIKRPFFGLPNDKKAQYCCDCKKIDMINIKSPKCIVCKKTIPSFGLPDDKKAQYCGDCKKDGMINIKSHKCIKCNIKHPSFGLPDNKVAQYCRDCKKDDMINIKSPKCIICKKIEASFGLPNDKKRQYCFNCKKDDMVNVKDNKCKSEWCSTIAIVKKYEGYCAYCFTNIYPDKPVSRNYKTKEREVVNFVKDNFEEFTIKTDKKIYDGCSRKRPDIFIDLGYQVVIVEVDENQHRDYDCSCENKRLMELSQDVNHRPIVFIRFNPDDYTIGDIKFKSCWGKSKTGIYNVLKSQKTNWNNRLNILKFQINYWLCSDNITNKTVEVIHLFYDE